MDALQKTVVWLFVLIFNVQGEFFYFHILSRREKIMDLKIGNFSCCE